MTVRLSIAIPTYNGSVYIREALDSIISQLEDINEEVEIVISDNASTDQTPEIIREYQRNYPFIKYFRNDEDLGGGMNFDLAVRRSTGEYVWLFGDDDILRSGAIEKVLDVLKNHHGLAAILVNWYQLGLYLRQPNIIEHTMDIQKDIFFRTADDFLSTVKLTGLAVSSNIIRRSLWEQHAEIYIGSGYVHYATLLTSIVGHYSYYVAKPYVMYRTGHLDYDKHHEAYVKDGIRLVEVLNSLAGKGYSKSSIRKIITGIVRAAPMEIIQCKLNGLTLRQLHIKDVITLYKSYPFFWIVELPLLLLPGQIYKSKIVRRTYRIVKKGYKKLKGELS